MVSRMLVMLAMLAMLVSLSQASYYYNNPCASQPCQNGFFCLYLGGGDPGYECSCEFSFPRVWFGLNCDQETNDYCGTHNPCQNLGVCSNGPGDQYSCTCKNGYLGANCEIPPPECLLENPCASGVCACAGEPSTYFGDDCRGDLVCYCYPDRNGTLCDEVVPCPADPDYNPCKNNGVCSPADNGTSFTCDCTNSNGFSGPTCQTPPSDGGKKKRRTDALEKRQKWLDSQKTKITQVV